VVANFGHFHCPLLGDDFAQGDRFSPRIVVQALLLIDAELYCRPLEAAFLGYKSIKRSFADTGFWIIFRSSS
jgi:hypothetical protein